ncbi:MAG TPA: MBL fold metallo-hydrolase [Rhabdaerophilum sp.]|nr:MBL fold metallo-hydrolase [Rhabdaerophilum sp.]
MDNDKAVTLGVTRRFFLQGVAGTVAVGMAMPSRAIEVAKLGERSIHVISDGGFQMPLAAVSRGVAPDELIALLKTEGLPTDVSNTVLNVTLIKDGEDWTILDAGSGGNFLPGSGKLAANLEAAGIDKAKVKKVIFTHGHPDHLWGAIDEFDSDLFPNASYQISEGEWAFWQSPDVYSKLPEDRHMFAAGAQRILKAIAEKTTRFKPGQEVAPGIVAVDTPGHTPGHVSFAVSSGGKSVLVLGDAITHKAISFLHPEWKSGSDTDVEMAAATRKKLLDQLATDKLPFIGYHLPSPGLGRAEKNGNAYRFVEGA